ncbi:RING finger protein 10 [Frankliniella occidentalis]|uniref:E3 ubiquitin-protein ligase RNF10 n=1 Tax=Frankliniella occidentalis TaxID=133901 RepID=A0A6J1S9J1_FRAOC|nr:RING finger protein 10 [Frankliniella occidentalis]
MLEEYIMEKKPVRSVQALGKGPGTDTKKSQDGAGGKAFPRSSRRRETAGASAPKYDPVRKPTAQKGKAFDKRPRPRGPYLEGRKEGPQIAAEEMEYGSVIAPGSKKQNLNHLLNFHYAPREGTSNQHWRHHTNSGHGSGLARYFRGTPHKYNKEQFLQANCQFAVKSDGDYKQYLCNPDQLVDWDLVEQIRVMSPEETNCPICLYPPVAAKMTRCGHIFCWSCILHYLALSDKSWRKCPICYESVHKRDLKSVLALKPTAFSVGGEITMRLMRRERGSLEAVPVEQWDLRPSVPLLSVSESAVDTFYAKLLLADSSDVLKIMDGEKAALQEQLKTDNGSPEVCFVEQAMEMWLEREALVKGVKLDRSVSDLKKAELLNEPQEVYTTMAMVEEGASGEISEAKDIFNGAAVTVDKKIERPRLESTSSEDNGTTITAEDLEHSTLKQPLKHFYFYQAMDGQHIYLHALNARMLEMAYGSLEKCPLTISGCIVEKEMGSMTEDLRKRLRYMQHLPVTCQFEVVELTLDESIIPLEILDIFKEQVETRRRRRQKRDREEMRREKKINDEENRRWGRHPTPHIRIASHHHFPICGNESSPPSSSVPKSPSVSSLASTSTQSSLNISVENLNLDGPQEVEQYPAVGQETPTDSNGPSFAQMLRTGKNSFSSRAGWNRQSTPLTQPMLSSPAHRQRTASDSEPEPEGYVPAPTFSQSFSDAIAIALAKSEGPSHEANADLSGGGKKKKKQKPKVLFSTSMAFSGK